MAEKKNPDHVSLKEIYRDVETLIEQIKPDGEAMTMDTTVEAGRRADWLNALNEILDKLMKLCLLHDFKDFKPGTGGGGGD